MGAPAATRPAAAVLQRSAYPTTSGSSRPTSATLSVIGEPQQHGNWCWAAVCVSILKFFGKSSTITQTDLANTYVGGLDKQYDPADVLNIYSVYDGVDKEFPAKAVCDCLIDGYPVLVMIKRMTDRHYLLIRGFRETSKAIQYLVYDPDGGSENWRAKSSIASSIVGVVYTKR